MASNRIVMNLAAVGMDDPLLTENEVSAFTLESPRTIQGRRYNGTGPKFVRLGNRVRYRKSDLLAWIDANTRTSTSDTGK